MDLQTFQLVTDRLPEAILLVEPCGRIRAANERARRALAPAGEALAGRDFASFAGERANQVRGLLDACVAERCPRTVRLRLHGPDGQPRAFTACGAPLAGPENGEGPLVQLRLAESEPIPRPVGLGDRLEALQRQLSELRERLAGEFDLRQHVDGLRRQLDEEIRLRRAIEEEVRRLEWAALHDGLTTLANRTLFDDRLERALAVARREGGRVGVLMIDLDGFKSVNDTLGHHAGDVVLRAVARRLRSIVREADTVARLGGDEFAVLMATGVDPAGIEAVAAKLAQALDLPFSVEGHVVDVGASIGAALYPDDGHDAETLLRRADRAMYQVKRTGGLRDGRRADGCFRGRAPLFV